MTEDLRDRLVDAALQHVPFDGWSPASFESAIADAGVDRTVARATFPRGAVDLALAFHRRGDAQMARRLLAEDLDELRFRDRVARAVEVRLEVVAEHKEAVRRGTTLFALPMYAADGAKAIWGTADAIWTALGDPSDDINWYTKRATLSAVYSSTVLYWLGDQSEDHTATRAFIDRRIEGVMQFEKVKKAVNDNRFLRPFLAGPNLILGRIRAPTRMPNVDLPGSWSTPAGPGPEPQDP